MVAIGFENTAEEKAAKLLTRHSPTGLHFNYFMALR
jgi:hypothetical protein